jgi:integrase
MNEMGRPRTQRRLPVVLSTDDVASVLAVRDGEYQRLAQLLYGTGIHIPEGLRVKDIDFGHRAIILREGKHADMPHAPTASRDSAEGAALFRPTGAF